MVKIIFASTNKSKIAELNALAKNLNILLIDMKEAGIDIDIEETGNTFEENAKLKASKLSEYTDELVLADDSGLEIEYLNNEPGIYSARYLGENTTFQEKIQNFLRRLEGVEKSKRTARFVCALSMYQKGKELCTITEAIEGYIGFEPKGTSGFGYDPIFYLENDKSWAEISLEEKNKKSHRAKAFVALSKFWYEG
ncbi:non-canonical purine NTP pyrophosphatase, RdgB/HAM1 family [Candidatus Epulonipiscioides gigas]|nr:non-canonical purine NTP pyrophosphatase, RdgB/HAM1 family [Epulopiscium sp. SCG-C07WGA-EpuloA2]